MNTVLRRLRAQTAEDGFTLVEMMMAIVILGIIAGPLSAGFFIALRTTDETSNRRAGSHDAQLLSIYLPPDVQNADDAITSGFTAATCSGVTASTIKLQLKSTYDANFNVVYWLGQAADGSWQLTRKTCTGTITSTLVAKNLGASSPITITRTPASGTPLLRVTMQVTDKTTPTDPTAYTFTVTARTRTCATTPCNA